MENEKSPSSKKVVKPKSIQSPIFSRRNEPMHEDLHTPIVDKELVATHQLLEEIDRELLVIAQKGHIQKSTPRNSTQRLSKYKRVEYHKRIIEEPQQIFSNFRYNMTLKPTKKNTRWM